MYFPPRSSRLNCSCESRWRLLRSNSRGVRGIDGNQAPGQQVRAGDVSQRLDARDRIRYVVQRVGGLGDAVTECFGCQIMSGPDSGIAAAGVSNDLIAGGRGEDRIDNRSVREMAGLDIGGDRQSVRLGREQRGARGFQKEPRTGQYGNRPVHHNSYDCKVSTREHEGKLRRCLASLPC